MFKNKKLAIVTGLLFCSIIFIIYKDYNYSKKLSKLTKLDSSSLKYIQNYNNIPLEKTNHLDILNIELLQLGKEEMSKHKIIITGIARDNVEDFAVMKKHIEYLGASFKDYKVVIFENDSTDGTKILYNDWIVTNPKVHIISKDFHNKKRPSIKFLADARNYYLNYINDNYKYDDFNIVAVLDMDMKYGIDFRGVEHSFSRLDQWDGVCSNGVSNQKGEMYDMFAFRNDEFPMKPSEDPSKYWNTNVPAGQKVYPINSNFVKVDSCFGGLAFYKREFIKDCYYDSIDNDCEHVPFHACMREKHKARLFMNPAQLIRYSHYQ